MPGFLWSTSRRRYIYASNGRAVPESRVRDGLQSAIDASKGRIAQASEQLIAGKINSAEWTLAMRDELKNAHRAAAMLANGGEMSPAALGRLGATLRAQYGYLARFSSQVENGEIPLDGRFKARAQMYIQSARLSYENQLRLREQQARTPEEKRILSAVENCADCLAYAARGWQPIGTLPEIGDSICRSNCRCHWEYR